MSEQSRIARAAAYAFIAATLAIHGIVAWVSPLQNDDWLELTWSKANEHLSGGAWLVEFLSSHFTFSDLVGFVVSHSTVVHAIVTPVAGVLLVVGLFTIASRRLPRFDMWTDVIGIVVLSALIWVTAPRAAQAWFHRPYAVTWVYGAAAALWLLAPYRCRWQPRGGWIPALFVLGLCAGSASRQVGAVLLVGVIYAMRRALSPRPRWMWAGLAGVVIGTAAVFLDSPQIDFKGFKAGFEGSLGAVGLSLREANELISLVLGFGLAKLALVRLRPRWGGAETVPDSTETMSWLWTWFSLTLLALLGPKYSEAMLFSSSLALCIAALPYFNWLLTSRLLRVAICAVVVGIHVIAWGFALAYYVPLGAEYRDRVAKIERTPAGGVAVIEPYSIALKEFWFFGEDWAEIDTRQTIAIDLFGLRGIEFSSSFRGLEPDPGLEIRLEVEGVSPEQLAAARAPTYWGTNLMTARGQFEDLIDALDRKDFSARLVVVNRGDLDVLHGRRLIAAAYERGRPTKPKVTRKPPDEDNVQAISVRPTKLTTEYRESYSFIGNHGTRLDYDTAGYRVRTMTTDLHGVVACNTVQCLLVDAFVPNL